MKGTSAEPLTKPKHWIDAYEHHAKPVLEADQKGIFWPGEPSSSLEAFKKATALVTSRSFHAPTGGPYLVPVSDMLNHHCTAPSTTLSSVKIAGATTFRMLLDKPVKKGEQIWNTYGAILPNHQLLHGYGFMLDENEAHDAVWISKEMVLKQCRVDALLGEGAGAAEEAGPSSSAAGPPPGEDMDALFARKESALSEADCIPSGPGGCYMMKREEMVTDELLTVLQVMHMDADMLSHYEDGPIRLGSELDVDDQDYIAAVKNAVLPQFNADLTPV